MRAHRRTRIVAAAAALLLAGVIAVAGSPGPDLGSGNGAHPVTGPASPPITAIGLFRIGRKW